MAKKQRNQSNSGKVKQTEAVSKRDNSIGNRQGTTQTGAQNSGGRNRNQESDSFTEDLRKSGNRRSRD